MVPNNGHEIPKCWHFLQNVLNFDLSSALVLSVNIFDVRLSNKDILLHVLFQYVLNNT